MEKQKSRGHSFRKIAGSTALAVLVSGRLVGIVYRTPVGWSAELVQGTEHTPLSESFKTKHHAARGLRVAEQNRAAALWRGFTCAAMERMVGGHLA